jgi:hypothetical protein
MFKIFWFSSLTLSTISKKMMWKIEAYVAACDMTIKDNVLKMMLSHPPRGTKSKSKIVENDKI